MKIKGFFLGSFAAVYLVACSSEQKAQEVKVVAPNFGELDAMLSTLADPPQLIAVSSKELSLVVGKQGTVIYLDPEQLETQDGSPLGENIQVELRELTNKTELILSNAQTVSNGDLLVSGGSYYLNMTSDGKQLQIKEGEQLSVEFPKISDEPMELFTGLRDSLGQMNWEASNQIFETKSIKKVAPTKLIAEAVEEPVKPLKANKKEQCILAITLDDSQLQPELRQYENVGFCVNQDCDLVRQEAQFTWHTADIQKSRKRGEFVITFEGLDPKGAPTTRNYEVTPVYEGEDYTKAMQIYEEKYKQYTLQKKEIAQEKKRQEKELAMEQKRREQERIAEQKRQAAAFEKEQKRQEIEERNNQRKQAELQRRQQLEADQALREQRKREAIEKIENQKRFQKQYDEMLRKQKEENKIVNETYKALGLTQFGWINCDRMLNNVEGLMTLQATCAQTDLINVRYFAAFPDLNSVFNVAHFWDSDGNLVLSLLPKNREVLLIGVGVLDGKAYISQTKIKNPQGLNIEFTPIARDELKEKLSKIV